jgi:hypothetical protein
MPGWADIIIDTLNKHNMAPNSRVQYVYWPLTDASLRGVLVRIRTALAEMVAELIALTPPSQEVPDRAAADQAVNLVITGERNTIMVTPHALDGVVDRPGLAPHRGADLLRAAVIAAARAMLPPYSRHAVASARQFFASGTLALRRGSGAPCCMRRSASKATAPFSGGRGDEMRRARRRVLGFVGSLIFMISVAGAAAPQANTEPQRGVQVRAEPWHWS